VLLKSPASTIGILSHFSERAFAFSSSKRICGEENNELEKGLDGEIESNLF